jgi:DNA repair exonuclease SbcCD ATPase subunit
MLKRTMVSERAVARAQ